MSDKVFNSRIILKHDIEENWNKAINFVPLLGEIIIYDPDENYTFSRVKIGDGVNVVQALKFELNDVVLKTPQDLSAEEIEQVRINLHNAGVMTSGLTLYPFNIIEVHDYVNFDRELLEPVVASVGAEIYNDYETNVATGMWARASGRGTQALGDFSDASGWLTKAIGFCSIASGHQTTANGHYSHAEGWATIASGQNAFSGGRDTIASGTNSFANGLNTIAAGAQQVVHGKFNISDETSLMIIGNGTSEEARTNAYKLDASGNGWFAGEVTVGEDEKRAVIEDDYVIINGSDFAIIGNGSESSPSSTVTANYIILNSSTEGSNKKFKITIDDDGILTAAEI